MVTLGGMATPAPALLALRDSIDARYPTRSKASDGILGDAAHAARASDHNQGNALDITYDPEHGPDLEQLAELLIDDERVSYVIWHRRIRNRAYEGGAWREYAGANPHEHHLHVSIHASARDDTSAWVIEPAPVQQGVGLRRVIIAGGLVALAAAAAFDSAPSPGAKQLLEQRT